MQSAKLSMRLGNDRDLPMVVELNVGGNYYTTSLTTLLRDPDSTLASMFSGKVRITRDIQGRFFIDRDGMLFRFVLDYLRSNNLTLPDDFTEYERLLLEAEYFQIKGMVKALKLHLLGHKEYGGPSQIRGFVTICVRGTFAFGRDGLADIKFRKLQRILVCGNVALAREVFGSSLNETRDPDCSQHRYTNRYYLKHKSIERAFDTLKEKNFRLITSSAGGAGYDPETEESKWNHFINFVFCRD